MNGRQFLRPSSINTWRLSKLIAAGADLNLATKWDALLQDGWAPINQAAGTEQLPIVKALIAAGADLDLAPTCDVLHQDGLTPMLNAADKGYVTIVEALIDAGANIYQSNNSRVTPRDAAKAKDHTPVAAVLDAAMQLDKAVASGDVSRVRTLLAQATSANVFNKSSLHVAQRLTALRTARPLWLSLPGTDGHEEAVKLLLDAGADVCCVDHVGCTALQNAASQGHESIVRRLQVAGSSVAQRNKMGRTPRDVAATNGHTAIVRSFDFQIHALEPRYLIEAVATGDIATVKELMVHGADPNAVDEAGETPLHVAVRCNQRRLLELLLGTKGVDTSIRDQQGHRRFAQEIYTASKQPLREIHVDLSNVLGNGGFGAVYKGVFDNQPGLNPAGADAIIREMEAMQLCKLPYLMQLLAVSGQHTTNSQLVLERLDGGNLRGYLNKKRMGEAVPVEYSSLEVAWVVANALADLHHYNLTHRDLKSHNVLLSSSAYIKLPDLGLARECASDMTLGAGTPYWTAPEVLTHDGSYCTITPPIFIRSASSSQSSVPLKIPFEGMGLSKRDILDRMRNGTLRPDVGDKCAPWLRELATACMAQDPAQRPNAAKVLTMLDKQRRQKSEPQNASNRSSGSNNSNTSFSALSTASLVNTGMVFSECHAAHSIEATECPDCSAPTPYPAKKLRGLLLRIAVANKRGLQITTTLPCLVCYAAKPFTATACDEYEMYEMPDDTEKRRLLVKIVERAVKPSVAA
ncbi:protein kinase [Achlya hypogyna]|uniref:Protein kinase n=1 Tax=Achlya hypogyna TaxID=1202772 RepID=A0A1V9YT42_ACHHY|nr:protein kinase [Achlya hypogyna]